MTGKSIQTRPELIPEERRRWWIDRAVDSFEQVSYERPQPKGWWAQEDDGSPFVRWVGNWRWVTILNHKGEEVGKHFTWDKLYKTYVVLPRPAHHDFYRLEDLRACNDYGWYWHPGN